MNQNSDIPSLAFEALAKEYPNDDGVRMTTDLAKWLLEKRQQLQIDFRSRDSQIKSNT